MANGEARSGDARRAKPKPLTRERLNEIIRMPAIVIQTDLRAGELLWLAEIALKEVEKADG